MIRCECGAFIPSSICPECGALCRKRPRRFRNAALGALSVITLAACYGAPYPEPQVAEPMCEDSSQDHDGDGYCLENDADENVAASAAVALRQLGASDPASPQD